jgi:uncharacterized protein YceK
MKIFMLLMTLVTFAGCGKTWRSKTEPASKSNQATSINLDQWSGRSDYIDTRWQVKSQP